MGFGVLLALFYMVVQEVGHRKTYRVARGGRGVPVVEVAVVEVWPVFVGPVRGPGLDQRVVLRLIGLHGIREGCL